MFAVSYVRNVRGRAMLPDSTVNIYGISLGDRSGSGMTSVTSWTLNVQCIKECNQIPMVVAQSLISNIKIHLCGCLWG